MSKSAVALITTWVLIGLVGAFLGGYFAAKKYACKVEDQSGKVMIDTEGSSSPTSSTAPNGANKTIVQPNEQK